MLGKLMKYELKSLSRAFIPMWILAPIIALMLSLSIRGMVAWSDSPIGRMSIVNAGNGMLMAVMVILFIGAVMGLLIMTVVFVIQRFWNGLLKEEGYLMFTLPVKTWELVVSKALTATLIACISAVVGIFAAVILAVCSTEEVIRSLAMAWKYFFSSLIDLNPIFWLNVMLFIVVTVVGMAKSIYHVYAAMSVGHLFQTHKVVGSCVAYIGISITVSVVSNLIRAIMAMALPDDWVYYWLYSPNGLGDTFGTFYLLYLLLFSLLEIAVYHILTERILSTRLNLE
ncbi:MAG: hypothetical protein HFI13_03075 [Lachnospiraceae bacterium]|nr:hypothetical protein [Lachnospiraceae bacterium]